MTGRCQTHVWPNIRSACPPRFTERPGHRVGTFRRRRERAWLALAALAVGPTPPGPLAFVCEWPARGIPETRAEIDAGLVLAAAARAVPIWPDQPRQGSPALSETAAVGAVYRCLVTDQQRNPEAAAPA